MEGSQKAFESIRHFQPTSGVEAMPREFKLHVHCMFDGISMSLPYGTAENYRLASALASELTGPAGCTISDEGETFYLEAREQLDALFALQRKMKIRREAG
jgi:hypothetical protein